MSDDIISALIVAPDPYFAGFGVLSGTVKKSGTPNIAVERNVVIFAELPAPKNNSLKRAKLVYIAECTSNPDGSWSFSNLSKSFRYTVQSWDSAGDYAPVIGAGLIAT